MTAHLKYTLNKKVQPNVLTFSDDSWKKIETLEHFAVALSLEAITTVYLVKLGMKVCINALQQSKIENKAEKHFQLLTENQRQFLNFVIRNTVQTTLSFDQIFQVNQEIIQEIHKIQNPLVSLKSNSVYTQRKGKSIYTILTLKADFFEALKGLHPDALGRVLSALKDLEPNSTLNYEQRQQLEEQFSNTPWEPLNANTYLLANLYCLSRQTREDLKTQKVTWASFLDWQQQFAVLTRPQPAPPNPHKNFSPKPSY